MQHAIHRLEIFRLTWNAGETMKRRRLFLAGAIAFALSVVAPLSAQLRVGAGKVDITPDAAMLPAPFTSIHDPLFTRAILIENGTTSALLTNLDVGNMQPAFAEKLAADISTRYGIHRENMIISAAHIHSTVGSLGGVPPGTTGGMPPALQAFIDRAYNGMLEAVKQAKDSLQPAEMGFGEGNLYLNVNRDAVDPKTRLWAQEANVDGPSDKTLAVLEFRKPNGGAPIAIYMNYAMHAVTMFLREEISGDFPETASRYIENVYNDKAVAMFTSGAAGDQNPLYMRAILAMNEPRIHAEMDPAKPDDPGEYNDALMRLFLGGIERPILPLDPNVAAQSWKVVEAQGTIMAEETLRVMSEIPHFSSTAVIQGSSKDVVCPGRKRTDHAREGLEGHYEDGPPVSVTVGALRIGDVALGRVAGEPYNKIGQELKRGSPFRQTMVVTLVGGGSNGGYMPSDDAYGHYTFQALGTRFKPGCAEMGIVHGVDDLLYQDLESEPKK
jgi:neutral ceramidase